MLETAGLISRTRRATARLSHLEAAPLRDVTTWLARYGRFWDESHERLDDLLAALQADEQGNSGRGGKTLVRTVSSFQSVADRDVMIASGMERGVREGDERLEELLGRLQAG